MIDCWEGKLICGPTISGSPYLCICCIFSDIVTNNVLTYNMLKGSRENQFSSSTREYCIIPTNIYNHTG